MTNISGTWQHQSIKLDERRHVLIIGGGVGSVLAATFLKLGWTVTLVSKDHLTKVTLFRNAGGLVELIGISAVKYKDQRWLDPIKGIKQQLAWCAAHSDRRDLGIDPRRLEYYGRSAGEIAANDGLKALNDFTLTTSDHPDWPAKATAETYVITPTMQLRAIAGVFRDHHDRFDLRRQHVASPKEVKHLARSIGATAVVICAGNHANTFRGDHAVSPAVGVTFVQPGVTSPSDPVIMTADLTYVIPTRLYTVYGGTFLEYEDIADVPPMIEQNFAEEIDALRQRLSDFGRPVPKDASVRIGARPVGTRIGIDYEIVDGVQWIHVFGLGGSGWTVTESVVEAVHKRIGKVE